MVSRRNWLLMAGLIGLFGLEFLQHATLGGKSAGRAIFPEFTTQEVGAIELLRGDESLHLDFKRGLWVVRERSDFFAEPFLVQAFLKRLPDLSNKDLVAGEAASHGLYGLGDSGIQVHLGSKSGEPLLSFRVGRPSGESKGSYLQPDGGDAVYRAAALAMPKLDPALWLNLHVIAGFDMTEVQSIEIGFADERKLNLMQLDNGRWNAAGLERSIAPNQVQKLMSFAINAVLRDVVEVQPAEVGLDAPKLSLSFLLKSGVRRLHLGASLGAGRALSSPDWGGSGWVVEVPLSTAQSLESCAAQILSNLTEQ